MKILKVLYIIALLVLVGVFAAWYGSVNKDVSGFFGMIHETVFSEDSAADVLFQNRSASSHLLLEESKGSSVIINKRAKVNNGYILYTGHTTEAYLIDRKGKEVYKWSKPFTKLWPKAKHVFGPHVQDENIYWMDAHPTAKGDLYVNYERPYAFPSGFGFAKLDKKSNVIWKYAGNTHHWFDVVEEKQRVYVLENKIVNAKGRESSFGEIILDDYIVILNSLTGKVEKRISIQKAFRRSDYVAFLNMFSGKRDALHSNKVTYIDAELASRLPHGDEGDLLVSLRNVNAVAIIDGKKKKVKWAITGPWYHPHDPDILDNGNLMILDNRSQRDGKGASRVLEFDIGKQEVVWQYKGTMKKPFETEIRGMQEVLSNGNVLIVSADQGRIFEVTRSNEIVWEFYNPHEVNGMQSTIGTGKYFPRKHFTFIRKR